MSRRILPLAADLSLFATAPPKFNLRLGGGVRFRVSARGGAWHAGCVRDVPPCCVFALHTPREEALGCVKGLTRQADVNVKLRSQVAKLTSAAGF